MDDLPIQRTEGQVTSSGKWVPSKLGEPIIAYDYFKSMTSVSVGTLGGILALSETVFGARIAPWQMGLTAGLVALSGILALQAKTDIVQIAQGAKPLRDSSRLALRLVPALFGAGLGTFLVFIVASYLQPA